MADVFTLSIYPPTHELRRDLGGIQSNILKPCQQLFTFPSVRYESGISTYITYNIHNTTSGYIYIHNTYIYVYILYT